MTSSVWGVQVMWKVSQVRRVAPSITKGKRAGGPALPPAGAEGQAPPKKMRTGPLPQHTHAHKHTHTHQYHANTPTHARSTRTTRTQTHTTRDTLCV